MDGSVHAGVKNTVPSCFLPVPQQELWAGVTVYVLAWTSAVGHRGKQRITIHPGYHQPLIAQLVKNLSAIQETWVRFLGQKDALEKEIVTHSSILAWRIPWSEKPGRLTVHEVTRVGHDLATKPSPPPPPPTYDGLTWTSHKETLSLSLTS